MNDEPIRTAIERNVKAVTLRPSIGQGTAVTRARLRDGLRCDVEEGPWTLVAGMTDKYGGTNAGPNPGVLGRAALGQDDPLAAAIVCVHSHEHELIS